VPTRRRASQSGGSALWGKIQSAGTVFERSGLNHCIATRDVAAVTALALPTTRINKIVISLFTSGAKYAIQPPLGANFSLEATSWEGS
jgi:hypothetical protein